VDFLLEKVQPLLSIRGCRVGHRQAITRDVSLGQLSYQISKPMLIKGRIESMYYIYFHDKLFFCSHLGFQSSILSAVYPSLELASNSGESLQSTLYVLHRVRSCRDKAQKNHSLRNYWIYYYREEDTIVFP
jgi:hypothetical protein